MIDAAGNIFGRRAGTEDSLPPVLFGSHIDSVPNGGNFDGDLGSLGAIEVVTTLNEARVTTRRPLEVVVWQNEEGFAFNNGLAGTITFAGSGSSSAGISSSPLRRSTHFPRLPYTFPPVADGYTPP
jgi:N-carbamoyl-L-amino-acid hydrolase